MKKNILFLLSCVLCITLTCSILIYDRFYTSSNRNQSENTTKAEKKADTTENKPVIYCIGDNQTVGTNTTPYSQYLSQLTGMTTETYACNNITTQQLAQELGVYQVTVKNEVTIPEKQTPVNIELTCNNHDVTLLQNGDIINPVKLNDIEGTLTYLPGEKTYTFTRNRAGNKQTVSPGSQLQTKFSQRQQHEDDIYIIFTGYNDKLNVENEIQNTLAIQKDIISSLPNDRYIVIGLTFETMFPKVKALNDVFQLRYDHHFINCRYRILTEDMSAYNIQWTDQDKKDIQQYKIPSSLKHGENNGNNTFNELLAKFIKEKMQQLQYIK